MTIKKIVLGISIMFGALVHSQSCTYEDLTGTCLPSDTIGCGYFITEICTAPNTVIYSNTVDQFNNQACCISEPCTFVNDMGNPESGICMVPNSIEAQQAPACQPRQPSDCIEFSGKIITLDVRRD